jgi:hypothetical protein
MTIPPMLRTVIAFVAIAYCGSRLVATCRRRNCVSFLGQKYYRAENRIYYWLVIVAHVSITISMLLQILTDLRRL